jgi:hypothetical protein
MKYKTRVMQACMTPRPQPKLGDPPLIVQWLHEHLEGERFADLMEQLKKGHDEDTEAS